MLYNWCLPCLEFNLDHIKWNDKPLKTQMTRDVTIIKSVRLKSRLSVSKNGITETVCISSVGLAIGWELLSWKKVKSGTRVTKQATHFEDLPLLRSQKKIMIRITDNNQVKTAEMEITSWLTGLIIEFMIMNPRIIWSMSALMSCKI